MWWPRKNHGFRMSLEVNFNVGFDDLRPTGEEKGHKIAPIGQIKSQKRALHGTRLNWEVRARFPIYKVM